MKAAQRQKLVFVVAGLGIAGALYIQFGVQVKKPAVDAAAQPVHIVAAIAPDEAVSSTPTPVLASALSPAQPMTVPSGWGVDPFSPRATRRAVLTQTVTPSTSTALATAPATPHWRVGGIIFLPERPVAYINDQPVRVGQIVDGAKVIAIAQESVTIEFRGERHTLTLRKG